MDEFRKPYLTLFNAVCLALEALDRCDYGTAKELLIQGQLDSEEAYAEEGEGEAS